jgi:hypothetical protein
VIGGWLWQRSPALVFEAAGAVSAVGLVVFVALSIDRRRIVNRHETTAVASISTSAPASINPATTTTDIAG